MATRSPVLVNKTQRRGMAWVFDRYVASDSPLYKLQFEAQAIRRGLWADHQRMPPVGMARGAQAALGHLATGWSTRRTLAGGLCADPRPCGVVGMAEPANRTERKAPRYRRS